MALTSSFHRTRHIVTEWTSINIPSQSQRNIRFTVMMINVVNGVFGISCQVDLGERRVGVPGPNTRYTLL